jgi:hypothetical protein
MVARVFAQEPSMKRLRQFAIFTALTTAIYSCISGNLPVWPPMSDILSGLDVKAFQWAVYPTATAFLLGLLVAWFIYVLVSWFSTWRIHRARLKLAQLRREGVAIRNEGARLGLVDDDNYDAWAARCTQWQNKVTRWIRVIDDADAEMWPILNAVPEPSVTLILPKKHHEGAHLKLYREFDFRITKLQKLDEKYSQKY